jgi:hypothetical protein
MNPILTLLGLIVDLQLKQNVAIMDIQREIELDNALDIPQAEIDALKAKLAELSVLLPPVGMPDVLG